MNPILPQRAEFRELKGHTANCNNNNGRLSGVQYELGTLLSTLSGLFYFIVPCHDRFSNCSLSGAGE